MSISDDEAPGPRDFRMRGLSLRGFSLRSRALLLMVLQCGLVSAVAGKYLYERETLPRAWVDTRVIDPDDAIRGRYLELTPLVNVCGLPHTDAYAYRHKVEPLPNHPSVETGWGWHIRVTAQKGTVVPVVIGKAWGETYRLEAHGEPPNPKAIFQPSGARCDSVSFPGSFALYVPEGWKAPQKSSIESYGPRVEVNVLPDGSLRAVAVADESQR